MTRSNTAVEASSFLLPPDCATGGEEFFLPQLVQNCDVTDICELQKGQKRIFVPASLFSLSLSFLKRASPFEENARYRKSRPISAYFLAICGDLRRSRKVRFHRYMKSQRKNA